MRTLPRDADAPQEPESTQNEQASEPSLSEEIKAQLTEAEAEGSQSIDEAPTLLGASRARARELLAARRSVSRPLADAPADPPQDAADQEQQTGGESGSENGDTQRKRRRPSIHRILGQNDEPEAPAFATEEQPIPPADAAQPEAPEPGDPALAPQPLPEAPPTAEALPSYEQMPLFQEEPTPAAAPPTPPTPEHQPGNIAPEHQPGSTISKHQPDSTAPQPQPPLAPALPEGPPAPNGSNGHHKEQKSSGARPPRGRNGHNGSQGVAGRPPRLTRPVLPQPEDLMAEDSTGPTPPLPGRHQPANGQAPALPNGHQQFNGHQPPIQVAEASPAPPLPPPLPPPASSTKPLPAVAIGRTGLVSEQARRERIRQKHKEAQLRWRRRRRFAFYLMEHGRQRRQRSQTLVRRSLVITGGLFALLFAIVIGATVNIAYSYFQSESSILASLPDATSRDNIQVFDSTGKLLHTITRDGVKHYIPLAQVSIDVINATIAVEDKDFWTNQGIDFTAIIRAASDNLSSGSITSGASSITQQLIKNMVLSSDPTFDRKLKEAILAVGLTQQYSKKQILEMYLNSIGYGENAYGIDAAALEYFDLQARGSVAAASQLDLAQASMLAGLPKNPNIYDPFVNRQVALQRQKDVLQAMLDQGYISPQEAVQAEIEASGANFLKAPPAPPNLAPHFDYWVEEQLAEMIDAGTLRFSLTGLRVYTTLDLDVQNQVQQLITSRLAYLRGRNVNNMAEVIIDQHTGAVISMLGSADYYNSSIDGKFNVATLGYRQMGSSFKPITYTTAFEKGWFPAQTIFDGPTAFPSDGSPLGWYKPLNYTRTQMGEELTVRQALQNSLNIPAVKTLEFAGIDDTLNMAYRLGITDYTGVPGLSMTLGSLGMHLLDMTSVYSTFANYGVHNQPFGIWRITDSQNNTLYQYTPHGEQVISPQLSYLITSVLTDNNTRAGEFGFCNPLYLTPTVSGCRGETPRPAAAKTGTTENFQDDLTMGYTMDLTMGMWAGNTDNSATDILNGITGAAPVWHDAMIVAEGNRPYQDFPVPPGLERLTYCGGVCSTDWFITGAVPNAGRGNSGSINKACIKIQPNDKQGDNWTVQCPTPTAPPGGGTGGPGGPGGKPCPKPPCPPPPGNLSTTIYGPTDHSPAAPGSGSQSQPQFQLPPVGDVNRFGALAL